MDEATGKRIIYNHGLPLNLPMGSSQQDPARPSVATKALIKGLRIQIAMISN
jgi:hypothetical protein